MKKLLLVLGIFMLFAGKSDASHIYGTEMTYTHLSGNTYILNLTIYRECFAVPLPNNAIITATSDSICNQGTQFVLPVHSINPLVLNMCDTSITTVGCNGPGTYGIESWKYRGVITLPGVCSDWVLRFSNCCMAGTVTNIQSPAQASIYADVHIDNLNYAGNSSPNFNFEPLTSFCINVQNCYNHSATDIDGDSIVYSLAPYPGVVYIGGSNGPNPIPTASGINLDQSTGVIDFTPNMSGSYLINVEVTEYRNGVYLGTVNRLMIYPVFVGQFPSANFTTGTVFKDLNSNLLQDAGEPGVPNVIVNSSPLPNFGSSNANGDYGIAVPASATTLKILNPPKYHTVSPDSHIVVTTGVCVSDSGRNFALIPQPGIKDACVTVDESALARPGRVTRHVLTLKNLGTDTIDAGTATYIYDPLLLFISSVPAPDSVNGNILMWDYTDLAPGECRIATVDFGVDTSLTFGTALHNAAVVTPLLGDSDIVNNADSLVQMVRGSFDPNDKAVEPDGDIDIVDVNTGLWLEYTIRFQNTGNDTAFYVLLVDTLDSNLDLTTFEMLGASHQYQYSGTGAGLIKWEFMNIQLPDSNIDEAGSNGFVRYRIKPKANLAIGTEIRNAADIYFDFNVPVKTNRTINTIVSTVSIAELSYNNNTFTAFPNPSEGLFTIRFNETPDMSSVITVYDMMGRQLFEKSAAGLNSMKVDLSDLANGMYLLNYRSEKNNSSERIILNR